MEAAKSVVSNPVEMFRVRLEIQNKSKATINNYVAVAKEFVSLIGRKDTYTKEDVLIFLSYLKQKKKSRGHIDLDTTTGTYMRFCFYALKNFFSKMGWAWQFDKSDVPQKSPPVRKFYTGEEIFKLIETGRRVLNLRDYTMLRVLALAFSRRLSIPSLTVHDYDPETGILRMPVIKGGRSILIQLDKETNDSLLYYLASRKDLYPSLFPSLRARNEEGRITPQAINAIIKRLCKAAGIENKGVHAIRRGIVTYLYEQGAREKEIYEMSDWRTPTMVHEYVQLSNKYIDEKRKQVHPFFTSEDAKNYKPKPPPFRIVKKT